MKQNLTWEEIYYFEEITSDKRILSAEWTKECKYRGGYLVKHTHLINNEIITESLIFIPKEKLE